MPLKRQPDEELIDFKIRVCSNKAINSMTWQEVTDTINEASGDNLSDTVYRKWWTVFSEAQEYEIEKRAASSGSEAVEELQAKTKEFEIAKIQFQDQKNSAKQYLRHEAKLDNLLKKMLDSIEDDLNTKKPLKWIKPIEKNESTGALMLLLSDLHRGMVTDNHWNKFNEEVFQTRLNQVVQETIDYQKITNTKELHIMGLGDYIEGSLHRMTKIGETETAVQQTQKVAEELSELVSVLSGKFEKVFFYSVKGNHDRTASRKEEEIRTESFHEFIPWYMNMRLKKHLNVTIMENEYDSEIIVADVCGNTYIGVHGHLDRHVNMVQNLTMMIKKFPKAVLSAHVHKNFENEIHSVDLIVNGGFAGTNDYAKDGRWTSKAHQKLLWLDERGRKATFYIVFD